VGKKQIVYSTQENGYPAGIDMSCLSEKSEMPLLCINEEGVFEFISPCAAGYFKSTPEQMTGKNINDLLSPDAANRYMEKVRQTLTEGKRICFTDSEQIMSRNHRFSYYFWPLRPQDGRSRRVMIMVSQLTEEKHADLKLVEAHECIEQIVKISAEPIVLYSGRIIHMVNESFAGFFGYSVEELVGKDACELIVAPQDRQRVIRLKDEGFCGTERTLGLKKDGTVFPCEVQVRKIRFKGQDMRCGTFRLLPRQPLTEIEKQVLELIMQGLGNKQIAGKLCRSVRTVEVHRAVVMKKYDAESIVDLVKKAIGTIPPR
jgi:PAS domain S-box-containing protein